MSSVSIYDYTPARWYGVLNACEIRFIQLVLFLHAPSDMDYMGEHQTALHDCVIRHHRANFSVPVG